MFPQGLLAQLVNLDILHTSIPWTSKIIAGCELLVDYLCIKAEDVDDPDGVRLAEAFKKRYIVPLKKKLPQEKEHQLARRKELDGQRIKNLPPLDVRGEAVNSAIIDLNILCDENLAAFQRTGKLSPAIRRAMNATIIGIMAYRTYPGRPGEWAKVPLSRVSECIEDKDSWYVIITDHKTKKTSGALGRYLPPEFKSVLEKFIRFSNPKKNQLLVPARKKTKHVRVDKCAIEFAAVYTPGHQYPEPTLIRKAVESEIAHPDNIVKADRMAKSIPHKAGAQRSRKLAAHMAGHDPRTGIKHYVMESGDPETDAYTSKAYIAEFVGPLPPLTQHQIKMREVRTTEHILMDFHLACTRVEAAAGISGHDQCADASNDNIPDEDSSDEGNLLATKLVANQCLCTITCAVNRCAQFQHTLRFTWCCLREARNQTAMAKKQLLPKKASKPSKQAHRTLYVGF